MITQILYGLVAASAIAATPLGVQHRHHHHLKRNAEPVVVVRSHTATVVVTNVETPAVVTDVNTQTVLVTAYVDRNSQTSVEAPAAPATTLATVVTSAAPAPVAEEADVKAAAAAASSTSVAPPVATTTTPSSSWVAPASSSSSAWVAPSSSSSWVAPASSSSWVAPSSSSSWSAPASSSSSSAASSAAATYAAGSAGQYAAQGKGITYSPYQNDGSCKSTDTISSDIKLLSGFSVIRVYAPDCSCVSAIMGSMGSNQQLFAGLFYMDQLESDVKLLADQVTGSSQGWNGVYAVSVGNEWVNSGKYSASQVATAVSSGRSLLSAQGYSGKVVTVDTLVAYEGNTELCEASDFIAANSHPYWDGNVDPSDSGSWLQDQISDVSSACGGNKAVLITETGWPTQGKTYGDKGVPSVDNQAAAIKSIADAVGSQVIFFTTFNDFWKDAGDYGVEQYWGIFSQ